MQVVRFDAVASDYFNPYTTTERVLAGRHVSKWGAMPIYKDVSVTHQEPEFELGPDKSERRDLDWSLRNSAASPWRYGLAGYERDWNVEERMR